MYYSLYYPMFDLTFTFNFPFLLISKTRFYHSPKLYHPQPLVNERTLSNDPSVESTYSNPPYPQISTLIQLYPLTSSSDF